MISDGGELGFASANGPSVTEKQDQVNELGLMSQ